VHTFYFENVAEIFPARYTWKVAEKRFKMAFMMNKLAMIYFCEIILEKLKNIFFAKNHCEIQVRTLLVCPLYSLKYGSFGHHYIILFIFLQFLMIPFCYSNKKNCRLTLLALKIVIPFCGALSIWWQS
jgi:hypothetical protein